MKEIQIKRNYRIYEYHDLVIIVHCLNEIHIHSGKTV
jgi:hypothetical protein